MVASSISQIFQEASTTNHCKKKRTSDVESLEQIRVDLHEPNFCRIFSCE